MFNEIRIEIMPNTFTPRGVKVLAFFTTQKLLHKFDIVSKSIILRHLPQKISKPHFLANIAPEENPLPGKTSLAWHNEVS